MTVHVDPITFEIIRHRLLQVIEESIIALENVSGSPIASEAHDVMVSLYRADGSLMVGGVGYLHHLTSASQAVKHLLAEYGNDPGIFEDDVYFFNDSYTAALHPPDVYLISPIHFEGELRGFVANFVHVTDIGAISPGGFSPNAKDCFHEGFISRGLKIVERGRIRRDVFETFLNNVRDPGLTALDLKSQLAANHAAKTQMRSMFSDFDFEVVDEVARQLIERSEERMRARIAELPDGAWSARQYIDMPDGLHVVEIEAVKQGDELTYDFSKSDSQSKYGINCSYWASWGAVFAAIFPLLAWDIDWNDGITRPFHIVAPEGTLVNAMRPAPISIATVGVIRIVNCLSISILSKIMGASTRYKDRATAIWQGSHVNVEVFGGTRSGEYFVTPLTDTFAGAGGARSFADGVDLGGEIPNVVSRWANVESEELNTPIRYLYRRIVPNSGGPGRFRGGASHEFAIVQDRAENEKIGVVLFGMGIRSPMAHGFSGGYPGCQVDYLIFREANLEEHPISLETTSGSSVHSVPWGEFELGASDVLYCRNMAGGGYGDPIERDPTLVVQDIESTAVSRELAADIYGVVLSGTEFDPLATKELRWKMRCIRIGAEPTREPTDPGVQPQGLHLLTDHLCISREGSITCSCGERLSSDQNWKAQVPTASLPLSTGGSNRRNDPELQLRQYYCPACAALLDTEVIREGDVMLAESIEPRSVFG